MPISFAQNSEDVLLWRCFGHKEAGFYVDVGASSPITDSVTHLFYEKGWSGLNLEPLAERVAEYRRLRPRDISLQLAAGSAAGTRKLHRQRGIGGLSTLHDTGAVAVHARFADSWEIETPVAPLSQVLGEHVITAIDFLKIDVEGAEVEVLRGLDLARWRPAVILVEATSPMTTTPSHQNWEPLLVDGGYEFCWFDGLNRFYLARERTDLASHFGAPPNVHDDMRRFGAFGSALRNPGHPDYAFAQHFAAQLLRAPGVETDAYLERVFRKDRPPALFERPVNAAAVIELYAVVLGRRPAPATIARLTEDAATGQQLLRQLLTSNEFRTRRARIAWG